MNTYEIYTTKFSQIVQARSAFLALQAFAQANPSEDVLCIEDVRIKELGDVATGFYCNDGLAGAITDLLANYEQYFKLRSKNMPNASKFLEFAKINTNALRKFLADRAAQKKAEIQQNTQPTLF